MSILADKQIARLCELPKFIITRTIPVMQGVEVDGELVNKLVPVKTYENTSLTIDEISELRNTSEGYSITDVRELTEAEKLSAGPLIYPFTDYQVRFNVDDNGEQEKIISYGLGPYSYDISLATEFKIFTSKEDIVIDPKNFKENIFETIQTDLCIVPPNGFVLGRSNEYFNMPPVITGILISKSTYSRSGLNMFASVIQCGFKGNIVLEFANTTPYPIMLYANEGCAQVVFFRGDTASKMNYSQGRYSNQTGIQLPFV